MPLKDELALRLLILSIETCFFLQHTPAWQEMFLSKLFQESTAPNTLSLQVIKLQK
jgi:hypothetical protein